jgi:hypothetical protein
MLSLIFFFFLILKGSNFCLKISFSSSLSYCRRWLLFDGLIEIPGLLVGWTHEIGSAVVRYALMVLQSSPNDTLVSFSNKMKFIGIRHLGEFILVG